LKGLAFFGAITASLSHEINNSLAVINELGGLIDDFLVAADQGRPLDSDRLKNVVQRILARVEEGKGHIENLNRFAHSVDHPRLKLDAREPLQQVAALCQRFARLRKVELTLRLPDETLIVEGSSFDLQHVFYRCIEIVLGLSEQGGSVEVNIEQSDRGGLSIRLSGGQGGEIDEEMGSRLRFLRLLAEGLGGSLESAPESGGAISLRLLLPGALRPLTLGADPVSLKEE